MSLEGRRIVVVGASGTGTGAQTAVAAAAAGAEVVLAARSEEGLAAVQGRLDRRAERHVLDMLDAILYLMDAKDVTGVVLPIDGGLRVVS